MTIADDAAAPALRLGASLPTATILGEHEQSDQPPGTGNEFATRYPEDLALLAELGVTDLRLGLDWTRLQPRPGALDDDWREWYQSVIAAAGAVGIGVWPVLLERSVPQWFDDDGGFTDARNAGRHWPRWVELTAEIFGEQVAGWFPLHDPFGVAARSAPDGSLRHLDALHQLLVCWRDAWRILRGGPPMATSLVVGEVRPSGEGPDARAVSRRVDHLRWTLWLRALRDGTVAIPTRPERQIDDLAGSLDLLGICLATDLGDQAERPSDSGLNRWHDISGWILRRTAEDGPDRPLAVTYRAKLPDDDDRRLVTSAFADTVHEARRDGIPISTIFWEPALDGPTTKTAPIDRDRQPKSSAEVWPSLAIPAPAAPIAAG